MASETIQRRQPMASATWSEAVHGEGYRVEFTDIDAELFRGAERNLSLKKPAEV
jgi:hypothetical protein